MCGSNSSITPLGGLTVQERRANLRRASYQAGHVILLHAFASESVHNYAGGKGRKRRILGSSSSRSTFTPSPPHGINLGVLYREGASMAKLKPCRDCGQQVSTKATTCPHCGTSDPARAKRIGCIPGCLVIVLAAFAISVFLTACGIIAPDSTPEGVYQLTEIDGEVLPVELYPGSGVTAVSGEIELRPDGTFNMALNSERDDGPDRIRMGTGTWRIAGEIDASFEMILLTLATPNGPMNPFPPSTLKVIYDSDSREILLTLPGLFFIYVASRTLWRR